MLQGFMSRMDTLEKREKSQKDMETLKRHQVNLELKNTVSENYTKTTNIN